MKLGKTLYMTTRDEWRAGLQKHHATEDEIWLVYYKKHTGKPRIPYNDAVEEALCYGWIDSIVKKLDDERFAQRFTPRQQGSKSSKLSETNKERIRRLVKQNKMTAAGLAAVQHLLDDPLETEDLTIAPDILDALKQDKTTWEHFQNLTD